jgi:hypothetical protein
MNAFDILDRARCELGQAGHYDAARDVASLMARHETTLKAEPSVNRGSTMESGALDILRDTLTDIRNMVGGKSAYGMNLTDPDHPWHETASRLERAIGKAEAEAIIAKHTPTAEIATAGDAKVYAMIDDLSYESVEMLLPALLDNPRGNLRRLYEAGMVEAHSIIAAWEDEGDDAERMG